MAKKKAMKNLTASDILREAADTIDARAEQRDQPDGEKSFADTAAMVNVALKQKLEVELEGSDIATILQILKIVRAQYGIIVKDDYVDGAAYAALAFEERMSER